MSLKNHPVALASALSAFLALFAQGAFNKVFEGVYAVVTERVQFPMTVKQIEYYRHVSDPCSPQVRNTIEAYNARIEYEHAANHQWSWSDWWHPIGFMVDIASTDQWLAVQTIPLNCDFPSPLQTSVKLPSDENHSLHPPAVDFGLRPIQ